MAETFRHDQAEPIDPALEQRIGGARGAVTRPVHMGTTDALVVENPVHTMHQSDGRIRGRARHLGNVHRAAGRIDRHDIRKGAAGIDADAKARRLAGGYCCHTGSLRGAPFGASTFSCEKRATPSIPPFKIAAVRATLIGGSPLHQPTTALTFSSRSRAARSSIRSRAKPAIRLNPTCAPSRGTAGITNRRSRPLEA